MTIEVKKKQTKKKTKLLLVNYFSYPKTTKRIEGIFLTSYWQIFFSSFFGPKIKAENRPKHDVFL